MPTFDISESDALVAYLQKGMSKAFHKGLWSAALRIIGVIQNEIIPSEAPPPIGVRRAYTAAWHPEVTAKGVDIINTLPYASIIEEGAREENIKISRAMIDALTEWVYYKGLVGRPASSKGRARAMVDARQMAWGIAMAMKGYGERTGGRQGGIFNRNGEEGLHIAQKASRRAPAIVAEEVAREMRREFH